MTGEEQEAIRNIKDSVSVNPGGTTHSEEICKHGIMTRDDWKLPQQWEQCVQLTADPQGVCGMVA